MRLAVAPTFKLLIRRKYSLLSLLVILSMILAARSIDFTMEFSRIAQENGLIIEAVTIEGSEKTARSAILQASGITLGHDILGFDVKSVRARIENLPWIKLAHVVRILPNRVEINVVEREPYALWQMEGLWLIDNTGMPIIEIDPVLYTGLPLLVGEGAPEAVAGLAEIMKITPDIERRVTSLIRVSMRRWDLVLDNGMRLKFPETGGDYGLEAAWQRFAELEKQYRILAREAAILDFRFPDRLVVRLTPEGQRALKKQEGRTT